MLNLKGKCMGQLQRKHIFLRSVGLNEKIIDILRTPAPKLLVIQETQKRNIGWEFVF